MAKKKKLATPRTLAEARQVKKNLEKFYPQMFDYSAKEKAAVKHLSKADQEAILERTTKKRLKAIYRSNKKK